MYQIGDQVVYGIHGICRIAALENRSVGGKTIRYYVLKPKSEKGAVFYVPADNAAAVCKMRRLLSQQELEALLKSPEARESTWIADENQRKLLYRELISSGDRARLVSMVGSLYRHKETQAASGRKFHLCDENFLRDAEKLLCGEFSEVLQIPGEMVGAYIRRTMELDE